ncbi:MULTISPECIES: hypothetical protein [Paenibacillus]|uniref:hypothetical protein n=2 Tax=Paenibacillus TaxID=44249 RepID=UPI002DB9BFCA|nr:hypothetical protein [Paenibacillus kribbensis]MEC0234857.1 hypothetical protein [Paenibacillus kribbensis]
MSNDKVLTNKEHKERIEKVYGKTIKEVMYEMIVNRNLDQWKGSKELGISKELFVRWRTQYELGPVQRAANMADQHRNEIIKRYQNEMETVNINREFIYKDETSLRGFKEMIERLLQIQKQKSIKTNKEETSNLSMVLSIGVLEGALDYINHYEEDKLEGKFRSEIRLLEWLPDDE